MFKRHLEFRHNKWLNKWKFIQCNQNIMINDCDKNLFCNNLNKFCYFGYILVPRGSLCCDLFCSTSQSMSLAKIWLNPAAAFNKTGARTHIIRSNLREENLIFWRDYAPPLRLWGRARFFSQPRDACINLDPNPSVALFVATTFVTSQCCQAAPPHQCTK